MAINITLNEITAANNLSNINANFATIEAALVDALNRDGTTPNTMSASLDMNSQDIINGGTATFSDIVVAGSSVAASAVAAAASAAAAAASAASVATSEANAATSATAAATSAGAAATSESTVTAAAAAAATSETNAATSETNAGTSETNAAASAAAADVDATTSAANAVTTTADVVLTNADVVSTNADVVLTNADVVLTNANVVLTNADVVTTNAAIATVRKADGRLTLTTAVPITTSDVTGAGTIYYTPYGGNTLSIYDGTSAWVTTSFSELSLTLSGGTASKPHDVFADYNAGSTILNLTAWTNDTTRATALVLQDGTYVKSGATDHLYLGTIYLDGSKQCDDSLESRHVWNMYNRMTRPVRRHDSTDNWTYTTNTWRQANASTSNRISLVAGLDEDAACVHLIASATSTFALTSVYGGIGLDSTTAISPDSIRALVTCDGTGWYEFNSAYNGFIGIGKHELTWLEKSAAFGTTTWYGDSATPLDILSGMTGTWRA